ncbi:hypothetical protein F4777DRAFT_28534 [Nemania sp. FL0916]|nr:hypothetical protein F4777DRAFT_28534 [Nemania sp. FL0916]
MSSEMDIWKNLPPNHPSRSTKLPWYHETFEHRLRPSFRQLLEGWSGIAPDEVIPHIYRIRAQAWEIFPWPCIGAFWFIEQSLLRHPDYARILARLKHAPPGSINFLDLGTCLGQDVRTLLYDGVSARSVWGADLFPAFRDVGYALFRDEGCFPAEHFLVGDIFFSASTPNSDSNSNSNSGSDADELAKTHGKWDIVHIAMFLHLFSLKEQEAASRNIFRLLVPQPGSVVLGTQTGTLHPGEQPSFVDPSRQERTLYRHSKETLKALFERSAKAVGLKNVEVWTAYDEHAELHSRVLVGDHERRIWFRVEVV